MNTDSTHDDARRARQRLTIYLVAVFAVSGAIQFQIIRLGGAISNHTAWVIVLAWTPGLVSFAMRLALREGFGDVSFRLAPGGSAPREWLIAWLLPVWIGALAYGIAWFSGVAALVVPSGAEQQAPGISAHNGLLLMIALQLAIGTPVSALAAAGEEFGWRGYMLTRLIRARLPKPILLSGLIWAAWHMPLILSGQYASSQTPALSGLIFVANVVAVGFVIARVRLVSGSVWPAVLLHSSWNAIILGAFGAATGESPSKALWLGESGLLVTFALVLTALALSGPLRRVSPALGGLASDPRQSTLAQEPQRSGNISRPTSIVSDDADNSAGLNGSNLPPT